MEYFKLDNSATDHLPVVASIKFKPKKRITSSKGRTVIKRSMQNFTKRLPKKPGLVKGLALENVNEKTEEFTKEMNLALDDCAPFKKLKVRENHKPGLFH